MTKSIELEGSSAERARIALENTLSKPGISPVYAAAIIRVLGNSPVASIHVINKEVSVKTE